MEWQRSGLLLVEEDDTEREWHYRDFNLDGGGDGREGEGRNGAKYSCFSFNFLI